MSRKIAEDFRVSMRNHRRDANEMLKRAAQGERARRRRSANAEAKVQHYTTEYIEKLDKVLSGKEAEVMEV